MGMLGAVGLGAVAAACAKDAKSSSSASSATSTTTAAEGDTTISTAASTGATTATAAADCVLSPEVTEGPYYLDLDKVRSDITDGKAGAILDLKLTVVNADTCVPIKDAAVDIWHADADGVYSGFQSGAGKTFLRGTQVSDAGGVVHFKTIYPGWYQGRAVHIHLKVHTGKAVVHTGQLFFADAFTAQVYAAAPYRSRGTPDRPNSSDSIYRQAGGSSAEADVARSGSSYAGAMTLGVTA
jgi:protocatechuate 3,4-dioxygenase beta subunit